MERVCCISLPQSASQTAPSSEGAVGNGGMREGRGARGVMGGGWEESDRWTERDGGWRGGRGG